MFVFIYCLYFMSSENILQIYKKHEQIQYMVCAQKSGAQYVVEFQNDV